MRTITDFESGLFELTFESDEFNSELAGEAWEGEVSNTSSDYVRWVRQSLNKILSLQMKVDGISGVQTRSAVRSFQQKKGLVADGIVGPKTEAALISAGAQPPPGFRNVRTSRIFSRPPRARTVIPARRTLPTTFLRPTNVTIDPRDKRIDFGAKFALQRMLKKAETQLDAIRLIRAIESGTLAGIYGDDRPEAVQIAKKMSTYRWLLVPKGQDAALVVDQLRPFTIPPTIIFRGDTPDIRNQSARIDEALRRASRSFDLWKNGLLARCATGTIEAETSFAPTPISNIVPPILCLQRERPFILIQGVPEGKIITPAEAMKHLIINSTQNVGEGQPNLRCDIEKIQTRLNALKMLSDEDYEKEHQVCDSATGNLTVLASAITKTLEQIARLKQCLVDKSIGWTPIRADEADGSGDKFGGRTLQLTVKSLSSWRGEAPKKEKTDISVFIPRNVNLTDTSINKVHVFFSAAGTTLPLGGDCKRGGGDNRAFNQVLLHGLRAAFDNSDWILINVPARLYGPENTDLKGYNTIRHGHVLDCLALAGREPIITEFRLSAYSRGHRGLRETLRRNLLHTRGEDKIPVSKVFLLDNRYQDITDVLRAEKLQDRVTGYQVICGGCVDTDKSIRLDRDCMRAIGYSRLIEDAMKREPPEIFKTEVTDRLLRLPPRGCFFTSTPTGSTVNSNAGTPCTPAVNLQQFCKSLTKAQIDRALELAGVIHLNNLSFFGFNSNKERIMFDGETDAHHYFVPEIVHEMVL